MSTGFNTTALLQSIGQLERLAKARIAKQRELANTPDPVRVQLSRYGVCSCSCHLTANTLHTGEPCCANAEVI